VSSKGLRSSHLLLTTRSCRYIQGPTWGYPTEGAYYRDAASTDSLLAVKIPFFAINAEDDPVSTVSNPIELMLS